MKEKLFNELLESVEQAGAIRRGEMEPSRVFRYEGNVLVEIKERGRTTWSLDEAAAQLAGSHTAGTLDPKCIREALNQSQAGFAEMMGISVGTLRGWEQGRRIPRGPAEVLLKIAASDPLAVLRAVQPGSKAKGRRAERRREATERR